MFELYQSENDQKYYWNLKAGNGEIILSSQGYADKGGANNGIQSVKTNCGNDDCWEIKEAADGRGYFVLKSTNGQVIGKSQMYKSESGLKNGIESVKKNAPGANVEEK